MSLAAKLSKVTSKLTNKFGATVSYTVSNSEGGSYDPATLTKTNNPSPPITVKASVDEYSDALRMLGDKQNSNQIIEGDKRVLLAASDINFVPKVGDLATFNGIDYQIIWVASQSLNDTTIYYTLHARRK